MARRVSRQARRSIQYRRRRGGVLQSNEKASEAARPQLPEECAARSTGGSTGGSRAAYSANPVLANCEGLTSSLSGPNPAPMMPLLLSALTTTA